MWWSRCRSARPSTGPVYLARRLRALYCMGAMTETMLLDQAKKAQGETNARLDRLILAQERTNQLLEWGFQLLVGRLGPDATNAPAEAGASGGG